MLWNLFLDRYNFEKTFNAVTGQVEGGEVSFADFVDILLEGPVEFAQFMEENQKEIGGMTIDTGMSCFKYFLTFDKSLKVLLKIYKLQEI